MTDGTSTNDHQKIIVRVDEDLEDLIPGFLDNRRSDVQTVARALSAGDFETIRVLGHSMKGSGGGYGFDAITEIGKELETAAQDGEAEKIDRWIKDLATYLELVEVEYEPY